MLAIEKGTQPEGREVFFQKTSSHRRRETDNPWQKQGSCGNI